MKRLIIPYAVLNKNDWFTVFNAFNDFSYDTAFDIDIYKQWNGGFAKTISRNLSRYSGLSILPEQLDHLVTDPNGVVIMQILCSDDLIIQCGMGNLNVGYGILQAVERPLETVSDVIRFDSSIVNFQFSRNIDISNYWIYAGNEIDSFMKNSHSKIVNLIAQIIYHAFPCRQDRRMSIGDCCPSFGQASGHPDGHKDKMTLDLNYYTLGLSNTTQYRPGKQNDWCWPITQIWDAQQGSIKLNKEVFDWERNYHLIRLFYTIFENANIRVCDVIYDYIANKAKEKYGIEAYQTFVKNVQHDPGTLNNHHTHIHIAMGSNIRLNARIFEGI